MRACWRGARLGVLQQGAICTKGTSLCTASRQWLPNFSTATSPAGHGISPHSNQKWLTALATCLGAAAALALQPGDAAGGSNRAECVPAAAEGGVGGSQAAPAAPAQADGSKAGLASRTRVVVLGSGWGAVSFLKSLDPSTFGDQGRYDLTVISPANYFLYTPLLPSVVGGTVEERSIVEPIRSLLRGKGSFYLAECIGIDPGHRMLRCAADTCQACSSKERRNFEVPYDVLLMGVGSVNNTFGIQGVEQHCFFLKTIDDAHRLRLHINKAIEHAGLPNLSREERCRHLNFVVVGGGPTGVELAAELLDLVTQDVATLLPHLKGDIKITVVDTMDHLLGAFDRQLSEYTQRHLLKEGISVQLGTMVRSVGPGELTVKRGDREETMPFGTCVWATGVAMHPLVRSLKEQLPPDIQNSRTGLVVDPHLRVKGANGTIFALGDAAVTNQTKALQHAENLFAAADTNRDMQLSKQEVLALLKTARLQYPQMGELASLLEEGVLERAARGVWGVSRQQGRYDRHIARLERGLSFEEFRELLEDMDSLMRALPATAQVANQEGKYLARVFSDFSIAPVPSTQEPSLPSPPDFVVPLPEGAPSFQYHHLGMFAYVGMDRAVMNLPSTFPFHTLKGWLVGATWRSFEAWSQVSARNRWMVHSDWLRTKVFGRNISEV